MQPDNPKSGLVAWICLMFFAVLFVVQTTSRLPDLVATHFGAHNQANGWMSRDGYLLFMLSFMLGVSGFVAFVVGALARKFPQWTNLPNRDYWLAPKRREESLRYLSAHGKWLACFVVLLMLGIHYVILKANQHRPPTLPLSTFASVLFSFIIALIWWIVRLYRRFPKPTSC